MLSKSDIISLLENTDFDEYDIREWFREFLKVRNIDHIYFIFVLVYNFLTQDCPEGFLTKEKVNM